MSEFIENVYEGFADFWGVFLPWTLGVLLGIASVVAILFAVLLVAAKVIKFFG